MISLKTIVVATDLSELSRCAIQYACELASQFGATLHLIHVASYPYSELAEQCQKDFGRSVEECENEYYEAAVNALAAIDVAPLKASNVIRSACHGFPHEEILRYAKQIQTDLLVVGTHGRSGLRNVLMGSVAETVLRSAPCPVLTVRDSKHTFATDAEPVEQTTKGTT